MNLLMLTIIFLVQLQISSTAKAIGDTMNKYESNADPPVCTGDVTSHINYEGLLSNDAQSLIDDEPTRCLQVKEISPDGGLIVSGLKISDSCDGSNPGEVESTCWYGGKENKITKFAELTGPSEKKAIQMDAGGSCFVGYSTEKHKKYSAWVLQIINDKNQILPDEDSNDEGYTICAKSNGETCNSEFDVITQTGADDEVQTCLSTDVVGHNCIALPRIPVEDANIYGSQLKFTQHNGGEVDIPRYELRVYKKPECIETDLAFILFRGVHTFSEIPRDYYYKIKDNT